MNFVVFVGVLLMEYVSEVSFCVMIIRMLIIIWLSFFRILFVGVGFFVFCFFGWFKEVDLIVVIVVCYLECFVSGIDVENVLFNGGFV